MFFFPATSNVQQSYRGKLFSMKKLIYFFSFFKWKTVPGLWVEKRFQMLVWYESILPFTKQLALMPQRLRMKSDWNHINGSSRAVSVLQADAPSLWWTHGNSERFHKQSESKSVPQTVSNVSEKETSHIKQWKLQCIKLVDCNIQILWVAEAYSVTRRVSQPVW